MPIRVQYKCGTTVLDDRLAAGQGYQVIALPYRGSGLALIIVLPESGRFQEIQAGFTDAWLRGLLGGLERQEIALTMPKFSFETPDMALKETLSAMGMTDAFVEFQADLSGMDGTDELYVDEIRHRAFIDVDERGTEAAAVTVVVVTKIVGGELDPPEPIVVRIDRPFLFAIRDTETGTMLFVGRVLDPR